MPRAPQYRPEAGLVQTTDARFRPANDGGGIAGAFADGMQGVGKELADYARVEDAIQANYDDTFARKLALDYKTKAAPILSGYTQTQGENALLAAPKTQEELTKLRDEIVAQAGNPRMKMLLEERIAEPSASALTAVGEHSRKQQFVLQENTLNSEIALAQNDAAASFGDPAKAAEQKAVGLAALDELGALKGWSSEQYKLEKLNFTSKLHRSSIDAMFSDPDPDVDMIAAYAEAHQDEMTDAAYNQVRKDLQQPLMQRQAVDDVKAALTGIPVEEGKPAAPATGWAKVATDVADEFGLDPHVVAAVMSYETGGTFSPTVMGGKNGQYMGLIQFGPSERKTYGITEKSTQEEWSRAVRSFLKDRGFKKGMGGLDLYSTINAGSPGKYNRSDNGGKDTVRSHYDRILSEHTENARKWLMSGGYVSEQPRTWDKDQVYNQIDALAEAQGWNPERVRRAKAEADTMIKRDEELFSRERAQADEDAGELVLSLGDGFKSVNQLPTDLRDKLSPGDLAKYQSIAERNAAPKEPPANGLDVMTLNQMRFYDPEGFKRANLAHYVGKVTRAELDTLLTEQAKMRTEKPSDWSPRTGITTAVSYGTKIGGLKLKPEQETAVMQMMETQARALYEAKGRKPLTDDEYSALFRSSTRSVTTVKDGWLWDSKGSKAAYELTLDNMSDATRQRLTARLTQGLGRKPTDEELLLAFRLEP